MGNSIINVVDVNNPGGNRRSVDLLPGVFRTDKNTKFLAGTLDQLIQPAKIEKISGWVGSKITPTYNPSKDFYIPEALPFRKKYQLEPGLIVKDKNQKIAKAFSYDDLINQLAFDGSPVNNLDRLFRPKFYSYDPHIDWDKFINFDQYYWVPQGPDTIPVVGVAKNTASTYSVSDDPLTKTYFVLTPDGLTPNPLLTLYRGVKYIFNVNSTHNFWIKTKRSEGTDDAYNDTVSNNGVSVGQVILDITDDTPKKLYYVGEDNILTGGEIVVKTLTEDTVINVEKEVLGKQNYTTNAGVVLTNGMKVHFVGDVIPEKYSGKDFIVDGVGAAIRLIDIAELQTPEAYTDYLDDDFDASPFDQYPFDNFLTIPIVPEYITISRISKDKNPWSRYNRWFHQDVLIATATANKSDVNLPQQYRAKRPIIEFKPNIQLSNFGSQSQLNVDHIDTITTDAFSEAEGQIGYYVDQHLVEQGQRVIFAADTDPLVRDKVYKAEFIDNDGTFRLHFAEVEDSQVYEKDSVVVTNGATNAGTSWYYTITNGVGAWVKAQQKTKLNQAPLFDVFDSEGRSFSDSTYYNSDFVGTKMFGYSVGSGASDPVLGFPLEYRNVADQGYYLFNNYYMTDSFTNLVNEVNSTVYTNSGFLKVNDTEQKYLTVWTEAKEYVIPIIQYQVIEEATKNVEITAIRNPGFISPNIEVFVNNKKAFNVTDYRVLPSRDRLFVTFNNSLSVNDNVTFKIYSGATPTDTGYYETSIGYTNNPLNGPNGQFTLSELSDHAKSAADRHPNFVGDFFGHNNIRDIPDFNQYGTRLITNKNPLSFASYFVCDPEHDVVRSIRKVSGQYNQFKLTLLKNASSLTQTYTPADALDVVLHNVNLTRDGNYPYSDSDMLPYGANVITRNYTVSNIRNNEYSLPNGEFSLDKLNSRGVIVYHTSVSTGEITQLLYKKDYTFDPYLPIVILNIVLTKGDTITVKDYASTVGCFVPFTPTKLGLYPKFEPRMYLDDTYANGPQMVIEGHDGSITLAYGDFRDDILLEFEKRVYNNIKVDYNPDLIDINSVLPGVFRKSNYGYADVMGILEKEFLKWAGFYGFDYETNETIDVDNSKTYNYSTAKNFTINRRIPGNWRGIYRYFFDTDRPHTHPWEMLGFPVQPMWWQEVYGPAPYTSDNLLLWQDLSEGKIADPAGETYNSMYSRPGLLEMIPVDSAGNLLTPDNANVAIGVNPIRTTDSWVFGDGGPVESAWRRNSLWPFAVQILLATTLPADYFSLMFDVSRMKKSVAGQYVYTDTGTFLNPTHLSIYGDVVNDEKVTAAGYSPILVEVGKQERKSFISQLKEELSSLNLQLLHKAGGFLSKDKLEIIIDSVNPSTSNPGVSLNSEDYQIFLNQGNPVQVASISGLIVQRTTDGFILKGYDKTYPYFTIFNPVYTTTDSALTVGGKSEPYVEWQPGGQEIDRPIQVGAINPTGARFYQTGQVVYYNNGWYRVKTSHTSGSTFNSNYFVQLSKLPVDGGVSVIKPRSFETATSLVPYGTVFKTVQEVYDVIVGYAEWLSVQGFVFDEYQEDLSQILDWNYASKEFLYWSSQGWDTDSVITISPFANALKFKSDNGVVDNILNRFYEYSILKADGTIMPSNQISMQRLDNVFTIKTVNTRDGIYFAQLNIVQKEHNIILNNASYFNDIIYDIESGYRQRRIKLKGFRTAEWTGSLNSPGFIYDEAKITDWSAYTDYDAGDVVRYNGTYYSAINSEAGKSTFNFTQWQVLGNKPVADLLPNFDLKINQFEDFYSTDIDNFDIAQQKLSQHLIGYSPRTYLDNIFTDQTTQYKFYQGFIKEKGTRNTINRLDKASLVSLETSIDFNEEWAFRTGAYGAYATEQILEFELNEEKFKENPQIVSFVSQRPINPTDFLLYKTESDLLIKPEFYNNAPFSTTTLDELPTETILPTAGYVRLDDITATAFSKSSLLDIANNRALNDGDTIWLGFRGDKDWDVYRYTLLTPRVIDAVLTIPGTELTITTDVPHDLNPGDLISISQFGTEINGVYQVSVVSDYNVIKVRTTLTGMSTTFVPSVGLLFMFNSARHENLDALADNKVLKHYVFGEKVWVDNNGNDQWSVYEKIDAYDRFTFTNTEVGVLTTRNQQFGYSISSNTDGNFVIVGSPYYKTTVGYTGGEVVVYKKFGSDANQLVKLISIPITLTGGTDTSEFGYCSTSVYDSDANTLDIIVGAPGFASNNGMVQISTLNLSDNTISGTTTLTNPSGPPAPVRFGSAVCMRDKKLYVGSPGHSNLEGRVFVYDFNNLSLVPTVLYSPGLTSGSAFGTSITSSKDGVHYAVGAPGSNNVYVYYGDNVSIIQDIISPDNDGNFGEQVLIDDTGATLFISAPDMQCVYVYVLLNASSTDYVPLQTIKAPNLSTDTRFGVSLAYNNNTLIIGTQGQGIDRGLTFDRSLNANTKTTFDSKTTVFAGNIESSGSVYVYNKLDTKFVLGQSLNNDVVLDNDGYGLAVSALDDAVLVGAPGSAEKGKVYVFNGSDISWSQLRVQEPVVDVRKVNRIFTIDSKEEQVLDYLEIIDPIKGRIPGIADQEIKFKTVFDPAVYSIGITGTVNDTNTNWLDDHVGELWWDLSSIKYVQYEQGDLEFRRNNWGKLFPGCTVDIYEWVKSKYLPSQWAALADTNEGLAQGVSGQPKFSDNSVISIKQVYNPVSNNFANVYYFWVKNKINLPSNPERRLSAFETANLIVDPKAQGIKYASVISESALMLTNIKPTLKDSRIHLSVEMDTLGSDINKHTEWLILRENDPRSTLSIDSPLLQKLIDSYIGRDRLGNPVPDPALPDRLKYGVGIRPRQSMFVDRIGAIRSLIEYLNSIFTRHLVNEENYNFEKLYASEQYPDASDGEYDVLVEDNIEKDAIATRYWRQAKFNFILKNGRIRDIEITDPGFGYGKFSGISTDEFGNFITWKGPVVNFLGDGTGAKVQTIIDISGSIIGVRIVSKGNGYNNLIGTARPHRVIVNLDDTVANRWSKYEWDYTTKTWTRVQTSSFDVTNYWKYIDWSAPGFVPQRTIVKTLQYTYQLPIISVNEGSYVRIDNPGDNKYIILQKLALSNQPGTFNREYNIVFKEKGTIQFLDTLWNNNTNNYGFDSAASWDQTPFSQSNEKELEYITSALVVDILNDDLQIYNNKLWFKAVKYALTEQKFLDWAFKTSFIFINHNAGALDQRPTYKLQNTSYYESYINETKPYHTKIRTFQSNYTASEFTSVVPTDFDMPSYYNTETKSFSVVSFGSPQLLQQPYKNWYNNYTFTVSNALIYSGGSGYRTAPEVKIVSAYGDPGFGATAEAFISLGEVTDIRITNPGQGYLCAPSVEFVGGGNVNVVPARAVARIANNKVRTNKLHIKLDRVSGYNEIGEKRTLDTFIGDDSTREFYLTWYPESNIENFTVKINGILVLPNTYTLENYTETDGYTKKRSKIILGVVPKNKDVVTVAYNKHLSIYNAVDRIRDYYQPVAGMPGNTATMLMSGLEYPGVTVDTLPFRNSAGWDTTGWASSTWDDYSLTAGYHSTYGSDVTTSYTLPYIPAVGQKLTIYTTDNVNGTVVTRRIDDPYYGTTASTNIYATTSTFIGNGIKNTVNVGTLLSTDTIVDFRLTTDDGSVTPSDLDIDTYIDGGTVDKRIARTLDDPRNNSIAGINIDGDGFVTPDNSHGPEENLPGRVSDTLGISVYTRPATSSATISSRKYIADGSNYVFDIGVRPASTASVQVLLGNTPMTWNLDYLVDFNTNQLNVFTVTNVVSTTTDVTGPYYTKTVIGPRREGNFENIIQDTGGNVDDFYQGPYPIGFEWNMFGTKFTELYVGTNGYLTFGGGTGLYTPVAVGVLPFPAIYAEYTDLWQGYGVNGQPLETGEEPGIFRATGTIGNFKYWRMRFQGSHYVKRNDTPTIPAYDYECTLYSDGTNQYVETIYETLFTGPGTGSDIGSVFGIANAGTIGNPGAGVIVSPSQIANNTSHVFYSTKNGGDWKYAGKGSFDPFKPQGLVQTISTSTPQVLSITSVGVGGTRMLESSSVTITGRELSFTEFEFESEYTTIQSEYVTLNGVSITNYIKKTSKNRGRIVIELPNELSIGDVLQVWFFAAPVKAFNEVNEQVFANLSNKERIFKLEPAPGKLAPLHNQAIVTYDGRRLLPPDIVYYVVANNQKTYPVIRGIDYGTVSANDVEVYVNGVKRFVGKDYQFREIKGTISFKAGKIVNGDAIAIVILAGHEYEINETANGTYLTLMRNVEQTGNDTLRVTTYNNHDGLGIRKERFSGNSSGRYLLSRAALNTDYVWVELNGRPLINEEDYKLDSDRMTVRLNVSLAETDDVVITSFDYGSHDLIGFRMFYDNFGRTHYKRLSGANVTELIADLNPSDESISVLDADKLTPPDLVNRIPGVILVDGERIEFYQMIGNRLTQLKRGALGTGIKDQHVAGSSVLDQGINQTIRIKDTPKTINISTTVTSTTSSFDVVSSPEIPDSSVTVSTTTFTSVVTRSYIDQGAILDYTFDLVNAVNYTTFLSFNSDTNYLWAGNNPTAGEVKWLAISEDSIGNKPRANTSWFTRLQTQVANRTSGTISLVAGPVVFDVNALYNGYKKEYETAFGIPLFGPRFVKNSQGTTSTVWYINVTATINPGYTFVPGSAVKLLWQNVSDAYVLNVPRTVVTTKLIPGKRQVTTSTQISTTGTSIWELTGIPFSGSENDLSRQASVYYQGRMLKHSLSEMRKQGTLTYDSGEVTSQGVFGDPIVSDEYRIKRYNDRYFLELFVPLDPTFIDNTGVSKQMESIVRVVYRGTEIWYDISSDKSLVDQTTEQVRFLRASPARLPDKYLYGQNTDSQPVLVTELGDTIDTESGEPFVGE